MGFPCGQVVGLSSRTTRRASTSSEITCSHRPASTWALSQSRPMMSTRRRSARRCLRTTPSASERPAGGHGDTPAAAGDEVVGLQTVQHLRDGRGRLAQALGQPGLDHRDPLLLEGEDRLEVLLDRRVEAVLHVPILRHRAPVRSGRSRGPGDGTVADMDAEPGPEPQSTDPEGTGTAAPDPGPAIGPDRRGRRADVRAADRSDGPDDGPGRPDDGHVPHEPLPLRPLAEAVGRGCRTVRHRPRPPAGLPAQARAAGLRDGGTR